MIRLIPVSIFAALLGGCGMSGPDYTGSVQQDRVVQPIQPAVSRTEASAAQTAMAALPAEAGRIEKVATQPFADGVRQIIAFDGAIPGLKANQVVIGLRMALRTARSGGPAMVLEKPTETSIRTELAAEFPTMAMQIVRPRTNAYGVYGLATGKWANGAACIYAWQWLDRLEASNPDDVASPVSLRLRLCGMGMTLDQLASVVDRVKLEPSRERGDAQAVGAERTAKPAEPPRRSLATQARNSRRQIAQTPVVEMPRPAPQLPQSATIRRIQAPVETQSLDPTLPAAAFRGPGNAAVRPTVY